MLKPQASSPVFSRFALTAYLVAVCVGSFGMGLQIALVAANVLVINPVWTACMLLAILPSSSMLLTFLWRARVPSAIRATSPDAGVSS